MRRFAGIVSIVGLVLGTSAVTRAADTKLAVLDLADKGVGKDLAQNLTDVVTVALNKLQVFEVLSRGDIQQMLEFEQQKQVMGCESDTSCLAEVAGALGVALLVSGSVGKVGSNYIINLSLIDAGTATVKAREQRQVAGADELTGQVEAAARFLVRDLLAGQQGYLILKSSESGADVEIDGRIVGVTPLPRQTLPGGPHTVKIVKRGFITWARDVEVEKDQPAVIDASLVPSVEFIEAYDSRAGTWRTLAYVAGGLGAAGLGFGVGGWVWNGGRADDYERDLTASNCNGDLGQQGTDCKRFEDRKSSIESFDVIAQIAGWTGAVALGVGVYLFVQGPPPGVYDQYRPDAAPTAHFDIVPTQGGAMAAGSFDF